ncbi:olfactory receptor 6B9-like [Ranitomeya variabilis]|uniref:olfactory receptor 6B9-like n=1 Tax=Ranitomeya variabilis TaxID=490064 RepID=UPI00405667F9
MTANLDQTDRRIMQDLMDFLQESDSDRVHKDLIKPQGRPIVASIVSLCEKACVYVDNFLQPLVQKLPMFVRNSSHFINICRSITLSSKILLVACDVESLYSNINHEDGQALIDSRAEEHFLDFSQAKKAEHCLVSLKVNNLTDIKEFVLLGFQGSSQLRIVLFCVLLVIFLVTICGNLLIITLVSTSKNLHTPMYFFISQLSISDIILISDIAPNILYVLMNNGGTIAIIGCMTQIYFFSATESFECLLLTVMCYDRYVAICNPLRYTSIMTSGHCVVLSISSWLLSFFASLIYIIIISRLKFCGPNVIDHLFCDLVPLQDIACSDTFPIKLQMYLLSIPLLIIPSIIFVVSYVKIIRAILQISSNISRQKAFSTCSSHLTVVSIFYTTLFSVYILPKSEQTSDMNKITSLLYTVFTPLINPIIYSFRNKDIKALKDLHLFSRKLILTKLHYKEASSTETLTEMEVEALRNLQDLLDEQTTFHPDSAHNPATIRAVPVGQFLRMRQICSSDQKFQNQAVDLQSRFLARGYSRRSIKHGFDREDERQHRLVDLQI